MGEPFAKGTAQEMRKELADLEADQAKATFWGAAVGERGKRIDALRRELARQTDTPNEPDTSAEAVDRQTELMLRYNLINAVKCMDTLAVERDAALASRDEFKRMWAAACRHAEKAEAERDALQSKLDEAVGAIESIATRLDMEWSYNAGDMARSYIAKLKGTDHE